MTGRLWLVVLLMGLVTYIPRMLPQVFLKDLHLSRFVGNFLGFVPYAVLGALIFPGVLTSTGSTGSAIAGGLVATSLACLRLNIVVVVFGGILGVYLWQMICFV